MLESRLVRPCDAAADADPDPADPAESVVNNALHQARRFLDILMRLPWYRGVLL
jgi:hypothetical protein